MFPENVSDRSEDVWEPLLAIADDAEGRWPQASRVAMVELCSGCEVEDESVGVILLRDIRSIFEEVAAGDSSVDRLPSSDIIARLADREESPWSEWAKGKPISARGVASILRQFGIRPSSHRLGADVFKGYRLDQFTDAFNRYLPKNEDQPVTTVTSHIAPEVSFEWPSVTNYIVTDSMLAQSPVVRDV